MADLDNDLVNRLEECKQTEKTARADGDSTDSGDENIVTLENSWLSREEKDEEDSRWS